MGLFLVSMAIVIVVVQVTLILSNREPNMWVFSLLQSHSPTTHMSNITDFIESYSYENKPPFVECVEAETNNNNLDHCKLWYHNTQKITNIFNGATWNPHLILLVISCIHLIICFSNAKEHSLEDEANENNFRLYQIPISFCLCILIMLCLIVGLISSNRNSSQQRLVILDTPTIIISMILFIGSIWFLKVHNDYCESKTHTKMLIDLSKINDPDINKYSYHSWVLIFQLQIIAVPLTVLMTSVMGVRIFSDVLTHFILLTVAVNSLWLQNSISDIIDNITYEDDDCNDWLLPTSRLLTIGIPLFCILIAQTQWGGTNSWQHLTVFMSFFSMGPLFIFPFLSSQSIIDIKKRNSKETELPETKKKHKHYKHLHQRLGSYCSTAALGCSVINLALL
jgi:hypothetical protein